MLRLKRIAALFIIILLNCSFLSAQGAKGVFYKTNINGKTVYLFGSFHMGKKEFYPLNEKVEEAFNKSSQVMVEVDLSDPKVFAETQKAMMKKAFYLGDDNLEKHMTKEGYASFVKQMDTLGLKITDFGKMKGVLLTSTIGLMQLQKLGYNPMMAVDLYISRKSKEKKIIQFESAEEQMEMLLSMTDEEMEKSLLSLPKAEETLNFINAWKDGNEEVLLKEIDKMTATSPNNMEVLLDHRNNNWIPKIEEAAKNAEYTFVVVGAGHLIGKNSVVELLKKKGYAVENMYK